MNGCGLTYGERHAGGAHPSALDNYAPVTDAVAKTNTIEEVWKTNFPSELIAANTAPYQFRTAYTNTDAYHLVAERRLFYSSDADCARMEP
jgi:hypothetical protein